MDLRYYPVKEDAFKVHIAPLIASHYKRPRRPADLSHYHFFVRYFMYNGLFWFLVYQRQQKKRLTVDIRWVDSTTIGIHHYGLGASKKKGLSR